MADLLNEILEEPLQRDRGYVVVPIAGASGSRCERTSLASSLPAAQDHR